MSRQLKETNPTTTDTPASGRARVGDLPTFAAFLMLAQQPDQARHEPLPGFLLPIVIVIGATIAFTMLWVIGMVTGRLLGLRPPWWRMLIAAYLGGTLGAAFATAVGAQRLNSVAAPLTYFASVLIASMLFTVLFELIALSLSPVAARQRGVAVLNPLRALRRFLARWARYLQITGIIARYGLGPYLVGRRGANSAQRLWARVTQALTEAGGAFVKLGQVLSTRADLLPPEAIRELSRLQDSVPPAPPEAIEALLTHELGAPPAEVFASFDDKPVAAASIAQAHTAELITGEQVIVKVQRPGIREPVERDLDILMRMARTIEARAS